MGRHTAPGRHPAQRKDPSRKNENKSPRTAPALPLAALVLTGLAGAGAAAVGTGQAVADTGTHRPASAQVRTQTLSPHSGPAPASREHRVSLGGPDLRKHLRSVPPTKSPSRSVSGDSADRPVTATGHCVASYYDTGTTTANGEPFDTSKMTAANKTLPFGTRVRVIDDATEESVVVRINDRGPYVAGRCLDLTPTAMRALAGPSVGTVRVTYQVLGKK